jgi:hypothetical protein
MREEYWILQIWSTAATLWEVALAWLHHACMLCSPIYDKGAAGGASVPEAWPGRPGGGGSSNEE